MKFNLESAVILAEAGDISQWEQIARHLLKSKPAPKARKSAAGPQTWAHVTLADGRQFLTSAYAKASPAITSAAHAATAQFRARMEDSGDHGQGANVEVTHHPVRGRRERVVESYKPVFLNPAIKAVPVESVRLIEAQNEIEQIRDHCFRQRGFRQGWIGQYDRDNPPASAAEQQQEAA